MIYLYVLILFLVIQLIFYVINFFRVNQKQLILIFKRALFFNSNPFIRKTIIVSTLKLLFKLIRKSFFKF